MKFETVRPLDSDAYSTGFHDSSSNGEQRNNIIGERLPTSEPWRPRIRPDTLLTHYQSGKPIQPL